MSTNVLKALPGKLDIKRHSPSILYVHDYDIYMYEKTIFKVSEVFFYSSQPDVFKFMYCA